MNSEQPLDQNGGQLPDGAASAEYDETAADESLFVAEDKKPLNRATLAMFGVLLVAAGTMYFMYQRSGPKAAAAAETAAADKTITQFLDNGEENIRMMEQMLQNTERIVDQFNTYPSTNQIPLSDLKTNPFRHGPQAIEPDKEELERRRHEEQRVAMLKAVQALQLQSIMHSDARRACMINSILYNEGQQVDGFTIEAINPQSVVVRKDGFRFELKMRR